MKKLIQKLTTGLIICGAILVVGYNSSVFSFSNGAPASRTGGLGESTCLSSGCHAGVTLQSPNTLDVTFSSSSYIPGGVPITVTVNNSGRAGARYGFQLKSVTSANVQAGTLVAGADEQISIGSAKQYIGHNSPGSTGVWTFQWTPPATNVGDVLFFVASYNGNGRGASTISTGAFALPATTVSIPSPIVTSSVHVFPNPATDKAVIAYTLNKDVEVTVRVTSTTGQMVSTYSLGKQTEGEQTFTLPLSGHIAAGHYVVQLVSGGTVSSHKLVVM